MHARNTPAYLVRCGDIPEELLDPLLQFLFVIKWDNIPVDDLFLKMSRWFTARKNSYYLLLVILLDFSLHLLQKLLVVLTSLPESRNQNIIPRKPVVPSCLSRKKFLQKFLSAEQQVSVHSQGISAAGLIRGSKRSSLKHRRWCQ